MYHLVVLFIVEYLFIHPVDGHLHFSQFEAIMKIAILNTVYRFSGGHI